MPVYEFQCRTCDDTFELLRPIGGDRQAACPQGHTDTARVLSLIAPTGRATPTSPRSAATSAAGGGCCGGGGCACGN